jgi:hypothetical protein
MLKTKTSTISGGNDPSHSIHNVNHIWCKQVEPRYWRGFERYDKCFSTRFFTRLLKNAARFPICDAQTA